jgi:hypothetical protein
MIDGEITHMLIGLTIGLCPALAMLVALAWRWR